MSGTLPNAAGIGLRAPHVAQVLAESPPVRWFEVHSENYFAAGGPALAALDRIRARYPVALHGVGLSLGSVDPLDGGHLEKLERLADRVQPAFISEHLSWSALGGRHYNDLLPLPYTEEALDHVCSRVASVQQRLGREILVENVSTYCSFAESTIPEGEFVAALASRTGCRLLVDVNNVYVNACNHATDPIAFLDAIDPASVAEIHLAGFERTPSCLIDTHGAPVDAAVWSLYVSALERFGPVPTLIEWDTDVPSLATLCHEAAIAQCRLEEACRVAA